MVVCSKPFSRNRHMAASRMRLTVSSGYLLRAMNISSSIERTDVQCEASEWNPRRIAPFVPKTNASFS